MATEHLQFPITLTTLSPLHIGSGEELTSVGEYLTTSSHIYFLVYEELMNRLKGKGGKEDYFDEYVQKILHHERGFDFFNVLTKWGIGPTDKELVERSIRLHQDGLDPAANNKLQLCIKTRGEAYVPGSSIKGLLRMAMIFRFFKERPHELKVIEAEIAEILKKTKPLSALKEYWQEREMQWTLKRKNKVEGLIPERVFQAIRPYDTACVPHEKLVIEQVNRQSFMRELSDVSKGLDWLVECIGKDVELPFELTILPDFDSADFHYLKSNSPKELFNCLNAHTLALIRQERQLVDVARPDPAIKKALLEQLKTYEDLITAANGDYAIARMGKGKTLFFQTILPLLSDELKNAILDLIKEKIAKKAEKEEPDGDDGIFPHSRVLTVQDRLMMGWVRLEVKRPEIKLPENQVEGEVQLRTPLEVVVTGLKKVSFLLNGTPYSDVQLVLVHKHQVLAEGQTASVVVGQMSKDGRIIQVKISSSESKGVSI